MPNAANITVKKNDGTTDVVYTLDIASGGEKSPARWSNKTVGTTPAQQPSISMRTQETGTGTARRASLDAKWPKTFTNPDGSVVVKGGILCSVQWTIPQDMTQADINEATAQFSNVLASSLVKASLQAGYAPV